MRPTLPVVNRIRQEAERQASAARLAPGEDNLGRSVWYLFGHVVVALQAVAAVGVLVFGVIYGLVGLVEWMARMGLDRQRVVVFIERNSVVDVSAMVVLAVLFALPLLLRLESRRLASRVLDHAGRDESLPSESKLTVVWVALAVSRHLDHVVRVIVAVLFVIPVVLTLVFFLGESPVVTLSILAVLLLVGLAIRRQLRQKISGPQ